MTRVRAVKVEGCELAYEMVGSPPYLYVRVVRDSNVFSVRGELDGFDGFLEVMVVQDDPPSDVYE